MGTSGTRRPMLKRGTRWVASGRTGAAVVVAMLALVLGAAPLRAQVGHAPANSPYRDIRKGYTFTALYGQFGGSGGQFGIGPHDWPTHVFRYHIRTGSTVQRGLACVHGHL